MNYEINLTTRAEREATIQKRCSVSEESGILWDFRGEKTSLPIIKLSVDTPIYRMENCRTFSDQQDLIAKEGLESHFFLQGQDSTVVQGRQHSILVKLAMKESSSVSAIMEVLETEGQRDPILITCTGVVVNGNRRLAAIRELFAANPSPASSYSHLICMVLPSDTTADEIDDIEANEQARPATKLEYDWVGDAQLVRRQINKGRNVRSVANQLRRSESDIKNLLQSIDEADMYLNEWAAKPGQYSLVSGEGEQIFGDIPKRIAGHSDDLKNASRAMAWSLYENRDKLPGRIYSFNAAFGKLAAVVLKGMSEQLDLPTNLAEPESDKDDGFAIDIDNTAGGDNYSAIIQALKDENTRDEAVDVLIDSAIAAMERERGVKSKNAALKALGQIHSKLAGVDLTTAGIDSYAGISNQLEAIALLTDKLINKINSLKRTPQEDGSA